MYACICHAVTTAEVDAAIAVGASSVRAVRRATGAGQSCGSCVKRLSCQLAAARSEATADLGVAGDELTASAPEVPVAPVTPVSPARPLPARPVSLPGRVAAAVEHLAGCPAAAPALG